MRAPKNSKFLSPVSTAPRAADLKLLYAYAVAWAGWVQINSADWNAVADLAKVTALFERCLELDETYDRGGAHLYLGVIKSLLPAALGGKPELARAHFERARDLSAGENLMVNVLMAKHYARGVYDQELHDQLLIEVQMAESRLPGIHVDQYAGKTRGGSIAGGISGLFLTARSVRTNSH